MIIPTTIIDWQHYSFVILNAPTRQTQQLFAREIQRHNVGLVIRLVPADYNEQMLLDRGIDVIELLVEEGKVPGREQILRWVKIVDEFFDGKAPKVSDIDTSIGETLDTMANAQIFEENKATQSVARRIAIVCKTGYGRAPTMAGIAMISKGCDPFNAIAIVRNQRKGALNLAQANFLLDFNRQRRKAKDGCCMLF